MPDVKDVIKGLECVVNDMQAEIDEWRDYSDSELAHGLTCDCDWWYNAHQKLEDALALLKSQEPVKPIKMAVDHVRKEPVVFSYECPVCMCGLQRHWVACPICGTKVKWE